MPASAARAVLQTGEYDYASSLLVEDDVLKRMEAAGKGRVQFLSGSATTAIYLNCTDPGTEVDGERSNPKTRHPVFSDPRVRRAVGLLIDRQSIETYVYGRQGVATANFINNPPRYRSAERRRNSTSTRPMPCSTPQAGSRRRRRARRRRQEADAAVPGRDRLPSRRRCRPSSSRRRSRPASSSN